MAFLSNSKDPDEMRHLAVMVCPVCYCQIFVIHGFKGSVGIGLERVDTSKQKKLQNASI